MKTVLLLIFTDAHFVELSRLAQVMISSGEYKPIFWFLDPYRALRRHMEICRSSGFEFVLSAPVPAEDGVSGYDGIKSIVWRLPQRLSFILFFIAGLVRSRKNIKIANEKAGVLIGQYAPDLMVMCEENVGHFSHIPIRVFESHHIPTLVVPYTIANATEAAEVYYDSFQHQVPAHFINRLAARWYPQWVYEYRGRELLRLPAAQIISLERSGYHHERPWTLNSEESILVAVENKHMLEYYKNEGLPSDCLILTGALYDDALAEATARSKELRRKLFEELGLRDGLPILLCALPPSQFPRDCEFGDYDTLLSIWMETLSCIKGWNVVVRPHPRFTDEEINRLESFGVKVSKWDTATLVPLCDLYVASVSATIRWAIACGKPVVNYDAYQMKYADYKDVSGVLTVFSRTDFKNILDRLTTDPRYYREIENNQQREMSNWGLLDGKSSERMLKLFDDMISGKIGRIAS